MFLQLLKNMYSLVLNVFHLIQGLNIKIKYLFEMITIKIVFITKEKKGKVK